MTYLRRSSRCSLLRAARRTRPHSFDGSGDHYSQRCWYDLTEAMEPDVSQIVDRAQEALRDLAAGADGGRASADASLREIEAALATTPSARGTLGPLIGRLRSAMKADEKVEAVR